MNHAGACVTLSELVLTVVVFGTLARISIPSGARQVPDPLTDADLQLGGWRPSPADLSMALPEMLVTNALVGGTWNDRLCWTAMTVKSNPDGSFRVEFRSRARCAYSGCVQLERNATYYGGVLRLEDPVREINGRTYQQLFTVRVNDTVNLVPPALLHGICGLSTGRWSW